MAKTGRWTEEAGGTDQTVFLKTQVIITGYLPTFLRYMAAVRVSPEVAGDGWPLFLEEDFTSWSSDWQVFPCTVTRAAAKDSKIGRKPAWKRVDVN